MLCIGQNEVRPIARGTEHGGPRDVSCFPGHTPRRRCDTSDPLLTQSMKSLYRHEAWSTNDLQDPGIEHFRQRMALTFWLTIFAFQARLCSP